MIDGKQIGDAIIDVLHSRFETDGEVVAVDGNAICSRTKSGNPHSALQILSAYITSSGVILAQESIHEKTNEIPVFQELLTYLDIEGKTVTADAMHCQRETCRRVIQCKGDYLFGLKENQPSLLEDVRLFFEEQSNQNEWESRQTDVTFSEDDCRFLSENAHNAMNALRKFALAVHKNFLAAHLKKSLIKASMLSALLDSSLLLELLRFL